MRELTVEREVVSWAKLRGITSRKMGQDGDPDRLFFLGRSVHCWVEFKTPTGKLRRSQRLRIRELLDNGDAVLVSDNFAETVTWLQRNYANTWGKTP